MCSLLMTLAVMDSRDNRYVTAFRLSRSDSSLSCSPILRRHGPTATPIWGDRDESERASERARVRVRVRERERVGGSERGLSE